MKNSISSRLRFAALHDCETRWKQCGKPSNIKKLKGKIDRSSSEPSFLTFFPFLSFFLGSGVSYLERCKAVCVDSKRLELRGDTLWARIYDAKIHEVRIRVTRDQSDRT